MQLRAWPIAEIKGLLKSQKLEHTNKKYINCWKTMINTYNNSFKTQYVNQKKIRLGIKQLNYTTHLNR